MAEGKKQVIPSERICPFTDADLLRQCVDAYRLVLELRKSFSRQPEHPELAHAPLPDELLACLDAGNVGEVRKEMLQIRSSLLAWFDQPGIREFVWNRQGERPAVEVEAKSDATEILS